MDDYTWQRLLEDRRERRQRELLFAVMFFAVLLGFAVWYFFIYTRTPEYALNEAIDAIETHDAEKFARYVNLDVLTARAYDDLTVDFFTRDPALTPQSRNLFEKFYVLIKPQLTAGVIDSIKEKINSGTFPEPHGTSLLKGRQLGIDFGFFLERSRLTDTEFISSGNLERGNGYATVVLNIRNKSTNAQFPLVAVLEDGANGWQISYLNNYRNYLDKVTPLISKDITDYVAATKEIVEEHNNIFADDRQEFLALTNTHDGTLGNDRKTFIVDLIEKRTIPALKMRQTKLDAIAVPPGAKYLADLRKKSTDLSLRAWQQYLTALKSNRHEDFEIAESLLKQELETEVRIEDVINEAALNKDLPVIP